jgi:hypothetical protein
MRGLLRQREQVLQVRPGRLAQVPPALLRDFPQP